MTASGVAQIQQLAARLQEAQHWLAVHSNAMFSSEHWQHHAASSHPELPDDDSYLAFENCVHPDCLLVRTALLAVDAPQLTEEKDDVSRVDKGIGSRATGSTASSNEVK